MSKEWIIDVLGDMRAFAAENSLPSLARHLDEAVVAATIELAQPDLVRSEGYGKEARGIVAQAR